MEEGSNRIEPGAGGKSQLLERQHRHQALDSMADLSTESKMNAFEELAGQAMLAEGHGIVKVAEG